MGATFSEIYESEIHLAERAESAGFDSAWVAEHHFTEDGYSPSPFTLSGAIAARTTSLDVGQGIVIAPLYEPVRLAEDAATVHNVANSGGGRCILGIGAGYRDVEFDAMNVPLDERIPRLLDTVKTCRGAWSDGPFSLDGRIFDYPEVNVTPKPEPGLELVVGAISESGIRRSTRIGDGYIMGPGFDRETIREKMGLVETEVRSQDRDPSDFSTYVFQYVAVDEDGADAAWETVRDSYLYARRMYLEYSDVEDKEDLDPDRLEETWRSHLVHGTPEEVRDELADYDDFYDGEMHMILNFHYPGMDYEAAGRSIELFGHEVLPHLR